MLLIQTSVGESYIAFLTITICLKLLYPGQWILADLTVSGSSAAFHTADHSSVETLVLLGSQALTSCSGYFLFSFVDSDPTQALNAEMFSRPFYFGPQSLLLQDTLWQPHC